MVVRASLGNLANLVGELHHLQVIGDLLFRQQAVGGRFIGELVRGVVDVLGSPLLQILPDDRLIKRIFLRASEEQGGRYRSCYEELGHWMVTYNNDNQSSVQIG